MTHEEIRAYYERQVDFYQHEIEFESEQIAYETRNIQRERERIRELREYVWSKGVLTEIEMRIYGDKKYETREMIKSKNTRNWYYRARKQDTENLRRYEKLLQEMK